MDKYIDSKALTYYNNKIKEAYAQKKELPTKTSELINDSGFLNSHQDISGKADKATTLAEYGITNAYSIPQINDLLVNKSNIESGVISENNLAWYKYDSNYTLTGSYELIGDICFLHGYAKLINGWDKVYYSLPVIAAHGSGTITFNNGIKYSVTTGLINNFSVLEIKRVDENPLDTEDIIQFSLIYRYQ